MTVKIKKIAIDLFFNMCAFGIYIVAQQLIMMPIMSRLLLTEEYAKLIVYTSIFAMITNVLGSELGIARQVNEDKDNSEEYNSILLNIIIISTFLSIIALGILKFDILTISMMTIAIILANIRLYSASYFRMNKNFKNVLIQNIIYLIGIVIGIVIFKYYSYIWIPLLLPEVLALVFNIVNTDLTKIGIVDKEKKKKIIKIFIGLATISLLVNAITYFDKILIYPIIGELAVAVYFATNSMSKIVSLITNPMHSVILSWLKSEDKEQKNKVTKMLLKINIPMIIGISIISIPLTYIALRILYPQYLNDALILIIPICVALGFSTTTTLLKSVLLKYATNKKLVKSYLLYFIIFIILAVVMSNYFGIIGFTYANVISKIVLWISFLIILKRVD